MYMNHHIFLKEKTLRGFQSFFVGPVTATNTTVLDSGDICSGFSRPGWIPHLHVSSPACNGFLSFTPGATVCRRPTK